MGVVRGRRGRGEDCRKCRKLWTQGSSMLSVNQCRERSHGTDRTETAVYTSRKTVAPPQSVCVWGGGLFILKWSKNMLQDGHVPDMIWAPASSLQDLSTKNIIIYPWIKGNLKHIHECINLFITFMNCMENLDQFACQFCSNFQDSISPTLKAEKPGKLWQIRMKLNLFKYQAKNRDRGWCLFASF